MQSGVPAATLRITDQPHIEGSNTMGSEYGISAVVDDDLAAKQQDWPAEAEDEATPEPASDAAAAPGPDLSGTWMWDITTNHGPGGAGPVQHRIELAPVDGAGTYIGHYLHTDPRWGDTTDPSVFDAHLTTTSAGSIFFMNQRPGTAAAPDYSSDTTGDLDPGGNLITGETVDVRHNRSDMTLTRMTPAPTV
jgi:hypothetical protein